MAITILMTIIIMMITISPIIVHSTKLVDSDWMRGVQLIPNCTLQEYQLLFFAKLTRN